MTRWRLSRRAQRDLVDIRQYSLEQWGPARTKTYISAIKDVIAAISEAPMRGVAYDAVAAGYRRIRSGSHFIYYRVEAGGIAVARILHENMDVDRHL